MSTAPIGFVRSRSAYRGPDPALSAYQLQLVQGMYRALGPTDFSRRAFWILRKEPEEGEKDILPTDSKWWNRRLIPFVHNRIQTDLDQKIIVENSLRNIMLKPRQAGYTTWSILMRLLLPALISPGTSSMLISQNAEYAAAHFDILKRAWIHFLQVDPFNNVKNEWSDGLKKNLLHVAYSNRRELIFDQIESRVRCASAEVEEVGQGLCLHPKTWMQSADGELLKFEKIKKGDHILGSDGEPVTVSRVFVIPAEQHSYKGEARKVIMRALGTLPIICAPNHEFLTSRGMVEAKDLRAGKDYFAYPKRKLVKEFESVNVIRKSWPNRKESTQEVILDRDFGLICGLYLADGCGTHERMISITMVARRKKDYALPRILGKAYDLGMNPLFHKDGRHLHLTNACLIRWIRENFGWTRTKRVPVWWTKAPKEFLFGILEGWLVGDAWWNEPKHIIGYGKNAKIVLGMKELSIALGIGVPYLRVENKRTKWTTICGLRARNRGRKYELMFAGPVYEKLARKLGLASKKNIHLRRKSQYQTETHVFVKIDDVKKTKCKEFRDVTVDSADHLYCLPYVVTHNTVQHLVCTEVSRWEHKPEETMANVKEAIPRDGTLDIECTPNGMGGYFYEEWQRATNPGSKKREFKPHFHTWHWHDEYRRQPGVPMAELDQDEKNLVMAFGLDGEQIAWRREKIESLRHNFLEKYPEDEITCIDGSSVVVLADGSTKPISTLVATSYDGLVKTVKNGKITVGKVVGWHRSQRADRRMFRLTYEHGKNAHGIKTGVTLTEEHKVLTKNGWKRADECNGEMVATGTQSPGKRAFQVILGTVLGDAHVSRRRGLQCTQVTKEYVDLKAQVLSGMTAKSRTSKHLPKLPNRKRTTHLWTKPLPYFQWLREEFYPNGVKVVPWEMIGKINDFGIAVWYMDDGWMDHRNYASCSAGALPKAGIHLGKWSKKIGDRLAIILNKRGFECECREIKHSKYRIIQFTHRGSMSLSKAIGKYVPACMRYKLLPGADGFNGKWYAPEPVNVFYDKAVSYGVPPRMQKKGRWEKGPLYCLDVGGTHNFVTLGGVVHNCFLVEGQLFFERDIMALRMKELQNYVPLEKRNKYVRFKRAIKHRRYIIGADPAAGLPITSENPDYSAAVVIDQDTGEEMAAYRTHVLPQEFAWDLVELAEEYNNAEIVVERLQEGGTVIQTITGECQYWNVYKHYDWWKRDMKNRKEIVGFPTNTRNRPMALNRIRWFLAESPHLIHDIQFLKEAMSFVRDEKGIPRGQEGAHDDTVLCRAFAHYVRHVRLGWLTPEAIPRREKYGEVPTEFKAKEEMQ